MHKDNEVLGIIEGYVSGYLLHYDTIVNEITQDQRPLKPVNFKPQVYIPEPEVHINTKPKIVDDEKIKNSSLNTATKQKSGCLSVFGYLIGFGILIWSISFFKHWIPLAMFGLSSLIIVPRLYNWLKQTIKMGLRNVIASILSIFIFLLAAAIAIATYQNSIKKEVASGIIAEKRFNESLEKQKKKQQLQDSFNHYYSSAKKLLQRRKKKDALKELQRAEVFASEDEKSTINSETTKLYSSLAETFFKDKEYKEAIQAYTTLIESNRSNSDYIYKRAKCYVEMNRMQEAVNDLKRAIDLGDKPAILLHEKINPIKKKIAYYVTRCRDGTTSNAKGQGACSHHGGVRNWNEPVYEEYREYK
jgi:hypothetical protein